MISLFFVGDGDRDGAVLPRLVERILNCKVSDEFRPWARLGAGGRGYDRKLKYAATSAQSHKKMGVIATVDRDRAHKRSRLSQLQEGRTLIRKEGNRFPIALGEADPHGEAWLLDDAVAVRNCMELKSEISVPSVRKVKNPKAELESLLKRSPRQAAMPPVIWGEIATKVEVGRCACAEETGFLAFAKDVQTELESLVSRG